jgi:hypothetical protein
MFDNRNDPKNLLESLQRFLRQWYHGEEPWYGIAREKLDATQLPGPLRDLYSFAGDWPGDNLFLHAFGYRNYIIAFELLRTLRGKLLFAVESDGGPLFGTEFSGDDPPVWTSQSDGPWQILCESLAQFIVTMCLRETGFGGRHRTGYKDLIGFAKSNNLHVSPVWLDGPYAGRLSSFYLIESQLLVLSGSSRADAEQWGSTQSDKFAERFPELFLKEQAGPWRSLDFAIQDPVVPLLVRQGSARMAMRQHQEQADYHAAKAVLYQRLLQELESAGR